MIVAATFPEEGRCPGIPYFYYGNAFDVLEEELIENGARIEDYRPGKIRQSPR